MKVLADYPGKKPGETVGFYHIARIRQGQIFNLVDESHFSPKWMKKIEQASGEHKVFDDQEHKVFDTPPIPRSQRTRAKSAEVI